MQATAVSGRANTGLCQAAPPRSRPQAAVSFGAPDRAQSSPLDERDGDEAAAAQQRPPSLTHKELAARITAATRWEEVNLPQALILTFTPTLTSPINCYAREHNIW